MKISLKNRVEKAINDVLIICFKDQGLTFDPSMSITLEIDRIQNIMEIVESCLANDSRKTSILEIGLGRAYITTALHECFGSSKIDIHAVEHPKVVMSNGISKLVANTNVDMKYCDLVQEELPYENEKMDVVIYSETIEHISPTSAVEVFQKIHRILKRNGKLIVTSPNLLSLHYRLKLIRGKSVLDPAISIIPDGNVYGHIRLYTPAEITVLGNHCNFQTEQVKYMRYGFADLNKIKQAIYGFLYKLFPAIAPDFSITMRKV